MSCSLDESNLNQLRHKLQACLVCVSVLTLCWVSVFFASPSCLCPVCVSCLVLVFSASVFVAYVSFFRLSCLRLLSCPCLVCVSVWSLSYLISVSILSLSCLPTACLSICPALFVSVCLCLSVCLLAHCQGNFVALHWDENMALSG